jgi:hypothetical protein
MDEYSFKTASALKQLAHVVSDRHFDFLPHSIRRLESQIGA